MMAGIGKFSIGPLLDLNLLESGLKAAVRVLPPRLDFGRIAAFNPAND
jgi:hypothetical protein